MTEFPSYETMPERDTDPLPPPVDDGSVLHALTLEDAQQAVASLKQQVADLVAENGLLCADLEHAREVATVALTRQSELETQLRDAEEQRERVAHLRDVETRRLEDEVALLRAREAR